MQVFDDYGAPQADVPLVVNDATGMVVEVHHTGPDGKAEVTVPPGGSVTAFEAAGTSFRIQAVVDPPPGATVRFPVWPFAAKPPDKEEEATTYQVTFSNVPPTTKNIRVELENCDIAQGPPNLPVELSNKGCADATTHRLIAFAADNQQTMLAWGDVTTGVQPGGVMPLTLPLKEEAFLNTTVHITGLPDGLMGLSSSLTLAGWSLGSGLDLLPANGLGTLQMPNVPDLAQRVSVSAWMGANGFSSSLEHRETFAAGTLPASWSFDLGDWVFIEPLDVSVPEHPTLTWSIASPGAADWIDVGFGWKVGLANVACAAALPPTHPTSWRFPDVPDELSSFRPHGSSTAGLARIAYYEWETVDGYAQVLSGLPVSYGKTYTGRGATAPPP